MRLGWSRLLQRKAERIVAPLFLNEQSAPPAV
jgi:hypothetical protein